MATGRLLLAATAASQLVGCYLAQATSGQAEVLLDRRPVGEVLHDGSLPPDRRRRLRFLLRVRDFGAEMLGLEMKGLYTTYHDPGRPRVAWNVSASLKDRFEARTWWFPVVGTVPYLGFFDRLDAEEEAARLRDEGLDVLLRGVGGYSTLGWFDDPIFPTYLDGTPFDIARLVLHEAAHATVFLPSEVTFNENFATLVGEEGAIRFLESRWGAGSVPVARARAEISEARRFEAHMHTVVAELEALYGSDLPSAEKVLRRETVFERGKAGLRDLHTTFKVADRTRWLDREWNNAVLNSFRRYSGDLGPMRSMLLDRFGGDLRALIAHVAALEAPPPSPR